MSLPFSPEQFRAVFDQYHRGVGVAPLLLTAFAIVAVALAHTRLAGRDRAISWIVALLWLWAGVVYQWTFFTSINPAAWIFGALFVLQAGLLLWLGVVRGRLHFARRDDLAGSAIMAFALLIYPVLGFAFGHGYPAGPSFGTPCPTVIFTLGLLLWAHPVTPLRLVVIPAVWALVGSSATLQLGMWEDLALPLAVLLVLAARRRSRTALLRPRHRSYRLTSPPVAE